MQRKNFLKRVSLLPLSGLVPCSFGLEDKLPSYSINDLKEMLPDHVPPNVLAFLGNIINYPYYKVGIREGDNAVIESLLKLSDVGLEPGLPYARNWFQYLLRSPSKLKQTAHDRLVRNDVLPFSHYCGHYALSFSGYELYKRTGDKRARQLALTVADTILHYAARDHDGLVAHDDRNYLKWAIPDAAYFVVVPLMIASVLDEDNKQVYVKQALYQMHRYFDVFYDKEKGIVRTIRFVDSGLGKTYWCRAIGWLIWAVGGMLRYLDANHPDYPVIKGYITKLADGAREFQGPQGGLRAFVNDINAPEEITGTAMCAKIVHEGIRKDWLSKDYEGFVQRARKFVYNNIDEQGHTQKAYVRWAIPAEQDELKMGDFFSTDRVWYAGFLMSCLYELMFNRS